MQSTRRNLGSFVFCVASILVIALLMLPISARAAAQLRAGAAASNITPALGVSINGGFADHRATNVHDELHARCLVLDNGDTRIALAVVDSCMVPREVVDEAKQLAARHTSIPADHILVSATHSHSAGTATSVFQSDPDPAYQQFLAARIADGIRRAWANRVPARIGWGVGKVPDQVFNRRFRMKPGTIPPNPFGVTNEQVRMNPGVNNPDVVEPAGPTDPEVGVLSVQTLEGRPLALYATYSLHYVGGIGQGVISADYYGAFADRIQQLLGADRQDPPFVAMLANGTSGNINNVDVSGRQAKQPPFGQIRVVSEAVAQEVLRVTRALEYKTSVPLAVRQAELTLGVRRPSADEVARAKETMEAAKGPVMRTAAEVFARETVLIERYPAEVPLLLQCVRIGDLAILTSPCEMFVEVGLELKARSPIKPTFVVSLANGYNGYLPTVEHHRLGGYETWRARSSYLETGAAPKIVAALARPARPREITRPDPRLTGSCAGT